MKKHIFVVCVVLLGLLPIIGISGQGFNGPNAGANQGQVQTITAAQAKNLRDDSLVKLTGTIVQSINREKFLFRDSSGDVTVEIDRELWLLLGLTLNAGERVEIGGKIDAKKRGVEIEVKTIRKI